MRPPKLRFSEWFLQGSGDRTMTYINAFRCRGGLVMSADTEEDWGDYKNYVEKLAIVEDQSYPLAIGGAGIGDLIEPMVQEVIEKVTEKKPSTARELGALLKDAIDTVYRVDLPWLAVKKHERTPEFLVGAKPTSEDFCIFRIKGRRLYSVRKMAIIGYGTPVNHALLERMYRDDLPMQQAVMLAIYLVSLSKKLDEGVGGETSVVIVRDNGAWIDDPEYVAHSEACVKDFLQLIDGLFLTSVDMAIAPSSYPQELQTFANKMIELRNSYLTYSVQRTLHRTFHEPGFKGEPYQKMFDGATVSIKDNVIHLSEPSKADFEREVAYLKDAHSNPHNVNAARDLVKLLGGRQVTYLGKEIVTIQGRSGSIG